MGGYAQVKQEPFFPTIDTGSGTWEEHYPGEGVIPVIRTGAHFLMVKTEAFRGMEAPWFRTRASASPAAAMMEVDGYARQRNGGTNPLWNQQWIVLLEEAMLSGASRGVGPVGEDSAFCDHLRASGQSIAVDTNLVIGHVGTKIVLPKDYIECRQREFRNQRLALGIRG